MRDTKDGVSPEPLTYSEVIWGFQMVCEGLPKITACGDQWSET